MHLVLNLRLWLGFTFAGSEIAIKSSVVNLAQQRPARLPPTSVWHYSQLSAA